MTNRTFHQRFAKQSSSAAVRSDLFVVWYLGLCSKYHLIHGFFLGNPADPHKEHIRSTPTVALGRQTKFRKYSVTWRRRKQITKKRHSLIWATVTWKSTTFIQHLWENKVLTTVRFGYIHNSSKSIFFSEFSQKLAGMEKNWVMEWWGEVNGLYPSTKAPSKSTARWSVE